MHTFVLAGEQSFVLATETSSYSKRYDMIACCVGDRVLLPKISWAGRPSGADVRGINGAMLHQFIDEVLAQAVEGLDRYISCDPRSRSRSNSHKHRCHPPGIPRSRLGV
jgi:hypothetical protein